MCPEFRVWLFEELVERRMVRLFHGVIELRLGIDTESVEDNEHAFGHIFCEDLQRL